MNNLDLLAMLDAAASEFNFLILDNANIQLADARLTTFINDEKCLIFFEDVGWSEGEDQFVNGIYAFGDALTVQGFQGELIPLMENPAEPITSPTTGACVASPNSWSVIIGGRVTRYTPTLDAYARAGIRIEPNATAISQKDIVRFLINECGHILFAADEDLLTFASAGHDYSKFLQTTEWQHPDIAGGEMPSANVSIRSLVTAIREKNPSKFERGDPNTCWQFWQHQRGHEPST